MRTAPRIRRVHPRPHAVAVGAAGLAALALHQLLDSVGMAVGPVHALAIGGLGAVAGSGRTLTRRYNSRGRIRNKYGPGGWATTEEIRTELGPEAARTKAVEVRPSLASLSVVERRQLPDSYFGFTIGRSVTGPQKSSPIMFGAKEVVMVVAPPQTGKTALLGNWVIEAPGAAIATSTKIDLYEHTAACRAQDGEALSVFNPEGLGGLASTFRWSPVEGCDNTSTAQERASYLVAGASDPNAKDGKFWEDQAVAVLRCYLLAAALQGLSMAEVANWVAHPHDDSPQRILESFPQSVPSAWIDGLDQILGDGTPANTRGSIYVTLRLAVSFMGDPEVARACLPVKGETSFNVRDFVDGKGTLYLIGSDRPHGTIAPLLSALTGYVFEECKRLAADKPGQRHDPPVTFVLDEAALIVPVPLAQWSSDAGGRGITIIFAVQALAQLDGRWGKEKAKTIRTNSNVKIIYGGLTENSDLESITSVCGERPEDSISEHVTDNKRTPSSVHRKMGRTITNDGLRTLPRWHVLVLYRTSSPIIARVKPVWERSDVRGADLRPGSSFRQAYRAATTRERQAA